MSHGKGSVKNSGDEEGNRDRLESYDQTNLSYHGEFRIEGL